MAGETTAPVEQSAPADDGSAGLTENGNPFGPVLEAVPNGREAVEAALKKIEGSITQRFQEAADFRKQWEPFAELGLSDMGVEPVQQLMAFGQMLQDPAKAAELVSDPEGFESWWEQIGDTLGFFEDGEKPGAETPAGQEETPAWAQQLIEQNQQLTQRLDTIEGSSEQEKANAALEAAITGLKNEHKLDDDQVKHVLRLAHPYAAAGDEDAIAKGLADYQAIRGGAQGDLVDRKLERETAAVERGGQIDNTPPEIKSFGDATTAARQRLAAGAN